MTTSQDAKDRAQETAATAKDEGRHVAGVAQEEAKKVASEAADQAKSVVNDAVSQVTGQLDEQSRAQRDRVAGLLQTFGGDLGGMASDADSSSLATQVAREVASRAEALGKQLEQREPSELLDDVRRFARQRPGTFLLGALAAGVLAGRVLKAGTQSQQQGPTTGPEYGTPAPAYGTPAGETGFATTDPPRPTSTPGQPTVETSTFPEAPDAPGGPMAGPDAGYGERGTLPGGERL